MTAGLEGAKVESYSGYRGEETPRAVVIDAIRLDVVEILLRKRVLDRADGSIGDVWRCRLADGRDVTVERLENGIWRVSAAD